MSSFIPGDPKRTILNIVEEARNAISDAISGDEPPSPPDTVDSVDPALYAGLWYELARLPMRFQADVTVSTAEYTVQDDGKIGVHNVAYRGDEVEASIQGEAVPASGAEDSFSRLIVKFGGLLRFIPVSDDGNYWILKVADDYSLALVGTPDRRSLWLLGRDSGAWQRPAIGEFIQCAVDQGYPVEKLLIADWETKVTSAADE